MKDKKPQMSSSMRATILGLLTTGKNEIEIAAILGMSFEDLEYLYKNDEEWKNAFDVVNPYQLLGECMLRTDEILKGSMYRTNVITEERSTVDKEPDGSIKRKPNGDVMYTPSAKSIKTTVEQIAPRMPDIIAFATDLNKAIRLVENRKNAPIIEQGKWEAIEWELKNNPPIIEE